MVIQMQNITLTVKSEIKNLSKSYVVVLCGGTLDVARNSILMGLSLISQFVKNTEHTNVNIIDFIWEHRHVLIRKEMLSIGN